jgi:hypothetical protein
MFGFGIMDIVSNIASYSYSLSDDEHHTYGVPAPDKNSGNKDNNSSSSKYDSNKSFKN